MLLLVNPIQNIRELLVMLGITNSMRTASSLVKSGNVYVNGVRVANTDALLVIPSETMLVVDGIEYTIRPRE